MTTPAPAKNYRKNMTSAPRYWRNEGRFHWRNIVTSHGYVMAIIIQSMSPLRNGTTTLEYVWQGHYYRRVWHMPMTRRQCVTAAKKFADEIVNQEKP